MSGRAAAKVGLVALVACLLYGGWQAINAKTLLGKKLTRQEIDEIYGPLRKGIEYIEAGDGKITVQDSWKKARIVQVTLFDGRIRKIHKYVADSFKEAYEAAVKASGYHPASVQTFVTRHINWDSANELSLHSYGIAVDFDPAKNPRGNTKGLIDSYPKFVAEFVKRGWEWGGDFRSSSRDSMHFQKTIV